MNVCPFLCNSELLIPLLLLIAVITLLLLLLLLILLLLMQLIAKIITAVHFQVRVCNIRPFHTMSVCCGAFSLWIKKWCLLTCVSTSNIRNNKIWFNQKHDIVAVLFFIHKNKRDFVLCFHKIWGLTDGIFNRVKHKKTIWLESFAWLIIFTCRNSEEDVLA